MLSPTNVDECELISFCLHLGMNSNYTRESVAV